MPNQNSQHVGTDMPDPSIAVQDEPLRGVAERGGLDRLPLGVRYLDLVLLVPATILGLLLGAPVFGFLVGLVAWIAQRMLAQADRRWIKRARAPRTQLGLNLFEAFGRIWLLAGAIVLAGVVGGRADGLTAALVIFGAYSIVFVLKVFAGPPNRTAAQSGPPRRPAAHHRSALR